MFLQDHMPSKIPYNVNWSTFHTFLCIASTSNISLHLLQDGFCGIADFLETIISPDVVIFLKYSISNSFVIIFAVPLRRIMWAAALGLKIVHGFQQSDSSAGSTPKMGSSQIRGVIAPPGPWSTSEPLFLGSSQDLPH